MGNEEMQKVTGYAGRACLVTYSLLQGVTSAAIRQQTGHANVRSMAPYDRISAEAEATLQDVLSRKVMPHDVSSMKKALHHSPPESPVKLNERASKKGKKEKDSGGGEERKGRNNEGSKEDEEDLIQKTHELVVIDDDKKGEREDMKKTIKVEQGRTEEVDKEMEGLRAKIAEQEKLNEKLQATIDQVLASRHQQETVGASQHPPVYMHPSVAPPATLQENPWNASAYLGPGGYGFSSSVPEGVHGGNRIFPPHPYPPASVSYPPQSAHPLNQGQAFAGQHPGMPYTHPQYLPAHKNNREGTHAANNKEGKHWYTFAVQVSLS